MLHQSTQSKNAINAINIMFYWFIYTKLIWMILGGVRWGCMLHPELFSTIAPSPISATATVFSTKAIKGQKHENACSKSSSRSSSSSSSPAGEKRQEIGKGTLPNPSRILIHQSYRLTHTCIQIKHALVKMLPVSQGQSWNWNCILHTGQGNSNRAMQIYCWKTIRRRRQTMWYSRTKKTKKRMLALLNQKDMADNWVGGDNTRDVTIEILPIIAEMLAVKAPLLSL